MDIILNSQINAVPKGFKKIKNQGDFYLNFLYALGYPEHHLPIAELLARYHQKTTASVVLSPVSWEASHNDAFVSVIAEDLLLTEEESKLYFDIVANFLKKDGFTMVYHDKFLWLASKNDMIEPSSKNLYQISGRSLYPELASMDKTMYWQQLLTELQMLLHASPINEERQQQGKPLINGIWPWGTGTLTTSSNKLCTTPVYESMARIVSDKVAVYQNNFSLKDFHLVIMDNDNQLSDQHRKQLLHHKNKWYWNDLAYTKLSRWQKLRRFFNNANQTTRTTN